MAATPAVGELTVRQFCDEWKVTVARALDLFARSYKPVILTGDPDQVVSCIDAQAAHYVDVCDDRGY
jgi:hypothetical protein